MCKNNHCIVIPYYSTIVVASFRHQFLTIITVHFNCIRLVNGNRVMEGRVEVFHDGEWGTVCDKKWDIRDAIVVCHQLGYKRGIGAPSSATFGKGRGPVSDRDQLKYLHSNNFI